MFCFCIILSVNHIIQCSSKGQEPILIKLGHNDQWPSPQMSNDPWPRQRSFKVTGVKYPFFFFKMYLLLQTTCDIAKSWSYDSTSVSVYGVFSDFRSKVIKGSFPVRIQKSSKCIFFYKQHVILTRVGHMTQHQSVSMGSSRIWGQRSLRGHFRSEIQNL